MWYKLPTKSRELPGIYNDKGYIDIKVQSEKQINMKIWMFIAD